MSKASLSKPSAESGSTQVSSGRTIGATIAAPLSLQRKLTVNTPGDKYEQEADRIADMVMGMPERIVQVECGTCGVKSSSGGECPECEKKPRLGTTLQRLSTQGGSAAGMAAPPIVGRVLNTPGSPLPVATRSFMESRFGTDFSHVRVHTDSLAAESAAAVQAKAYTVGNHISFAAGNSPSDDHGLLAHELTHVLQQGSQTVGTVQRYQIEGPWNVNDPVHEVLTLVAVREALSKLPKSRSFNADTGEFNEAATAAPGSLLKDVKKSSLPQDSSSFAHNLDPKDIDRSAQQFVRGVVFPDDPKGLLFDDPKATTDYSSGMKWKSEFDAGKKGDFKPDKSDLIARSHFGDLQFFHGMASKDGESILDTKRQILEWSNFLLKISTGELEGKTKIGEDAFASRMFPGNKEMTLNEFFGFSGMDSTALRQRAFGALSHMIQDSHAEGHTERDSKGEITQFHSYSSQDSHKHDEKDAWGKGKTLAEHIQNTPGAEVAIQQCAEVLIKIDQGESREAILNYLDTVIFRLSSKGTTAGPGKEFEKNTPRGQRKQYREVETGGTNRNHPRIQPKLILNTPGDKYEQEADRVAEQVMRMPEPQVQRQCACGKSSTSGECSECNNRKKEATGSLQRVTSSPVGGIAAPPIIDRVLSSPGSPLPDSTRTFMESRFGQDFSKVRVHTDQNAAESANAVHARAYAVGNNVVFGRGESPTSNGKLLAHELTHVLQQTGRHKLIQRKVFQKTNDTWSTDMDNGFPEFATELEAEMYETSLQELRQVSSSSSSSSKRSPTFFSFMHTSIGNRLSINQGPHTVGYAATEAALNKSKCLLDIHTLVAEQVLAPDVWLETAKSLFDNTLLNNAIAMEKLRITYAQYNALYEYLRGLLKNFTTKNENFCYQLISRLMQLDPRGTYGWKTVAKARSVKPGSHQLSKRSRKNKGENKDILDGVNVDYGGGKSISKDVVDEFWMIRQQMVDGTHEEESEESSEDFSSEDISEDSLSDDEDPLATSRSSSSIFNPTKKSKRSK